MFPRCSFRLFMLALVCLLAAKAQAQNIGINVNGAAPHPSALLDIDASAMVGAKRGLLIPRMTSAERVAIAGPATGLIVYDTTSNGFWYFNGTIWVQLLSGAGAGWGLTGNAGTIAGTHFIGTTDNVPLEVRVNGQRAGWIGTGTIANSGSNTSWGYQALTLNTGSGNAAFGYQALQNNSTGFWNTTVGCTALLNNTTGSLNTGVGCGALLFNTTGADNTAVGAVSLRNNTNGGGNTSVGSGAMYANTTGQANSAVGTYALEDNTTGSSNSAFGYRSLASTITAGENCAFGSYALEMNTTDHNSAFGFRSLDANTSGYENSAFGHWALGDNTSGSFNSAVGARALFHNTTGSNNTAIGYLAAEWNTTGNQNVATGHYALRFNNTGSQNVAVGANALMANTSGTENTAVGSSALSANTTGIGNDAFGAGALRFNTTGLINTALGSYALGNSTTGSSNVAIGRNALFNNTTGSSNTALGYQAGSLCTTGSNNTAIGSFTDLLPNLAYATVLGSGAQASVSNAVILGGTGASAVSVGIGTTAPTLAGLQLERMMGNTSALFRGSTTSQGVALVADWPGIYFNSYYNGGQRAMAGNGFPAIINSDQGEGGIFFSTTNVANTVQGGLVTMPERMRIRGNGNVGIGTFFPLYLLEVNGSAAKPGGGTWTATSDVRLKQDVKPYTDGLAELLRIRPVRYRYNEASGHDTKPEYVGVIAQELREVAPYMVGTFEKDGAQYLNVDNSAMIYMLVNSVREQQALITELRDRIALLERATGQAQGTAGMR